MQHNIHSIKRQQKGKKAKEFIMKIKDPETHKKASLKKNKEVEMMSIMKAHLLKEVDSQISDRAFTIVQKKMSAPIHLDAAHIDQTQKDLNELTMKYEQNKPKKWVVMTLMTIIGLVLGITIPEAIGFVNHA